MASGNDSNATNVPVTANGTVIADDTATATTADDANATGLFF